MSKSALLYVTACAESAGDIFRPLLLIELAIDYAVNGDWAEAYAYARQITFPEPGVLLGGTVIQAWDWVVQVLLYGGDTAVATQLVNQLAKYARKIPRL